MPRYVRFSGLFLTAAVLVTGCTSSPKPAATAGTATPVATTSAAGTPTVGTSASATPLKSASPTSAKASASPTATPSPSASPSTTKPSATPTPTHAATPTPTPTPTKSATKPPADPIVAGAYAFPVAGCTVSYGAYHHDYPATDILAPRGCHFVAPTSGTVDEVGYTDKWKSSTNDGALRGGLFVSIVGADGVRYYGSHLSGIAAGIAPGVRVKAGDLLGYVGNTGDARGLATHVHFGISWPTAAGIWWVRRGWISPYTYLNSWRNGVGRSPSAAIAAAHAANGDVPKCRIDC